MARDRPDGATVDAAGHTVTIRDGHGWGIAAGRSMSLNISSGRLYGVMRRA